MKKENKNIKAVRTQLDDNQLENVNGGMKIVVTQYRDDVFKKFIDMIFKIKTKQH